MKRNPSAGIVFDLFHTLVDPEEFRPKEFHRAEAVADLLALDKPKFLSYWQSIVGQRMTSPRLGTDYIKDFAALAGVALSPSALAEADRLLGLYQDIAILSPQEEVLTGLKTLKERGCKLGLLSNTYERDVREWPHSPLANLFDATAFSDEIGTAKPEVMAYLEILGRLDVEPWNCTFVGDGSNQELLGAKKVGFGRVVQMRKFVAKNGMRTKEELEELASQADLSVNSFKELCDVVG